MVSCLLACLVATAGVSTEFPKVYDSETTPGSARPPSPAETLLRTQMPEGFHVKLFASEPDVRQPVNISLDERGRLWVVENYTYAESPIRFASDLRDRIVIFDDVDGDGRFDRRKVFWDQGIRLTSVAVGFGGVWVTAAPNLIFIPDRDRDDVPDGPPVVVLDGWDADQVHHTIVNGLKWGPDGWLYGRHGIKATSWIGKPGTPQDRRVRLNCSIWRYHPISGVFEVVTHGTTNPWGFDYDDHGEMFFINTVIGHLWHVVPGAHYERMYGEDFDPHTYQLMAQTADHLHWATGEKWTVTRDVVSDATARAGGGHAHSGLMVYLGDNWPERYRGDVFTLNFHGRRINHDGLRRKGAGYVASHEPDVVQMQDPWFRGVELVYGPDGGVFVADWSDVGECHDKSGVHRSSGRIYKITFGPQRTQTPPRDLATLDDGALVALQLHRNDYFVRQSRRLLQERAAAGRDMTGVHQALRAMFKDQSEVPRKLRALWALYVTGGAAAGWLEGLLGHADEHVRVWAIRLLADRPLRGDERSMSMFSGMAARDRSGLVQLYLASVLQRLPPERRGAIGMALAQRPEYASDANLSLMLWYGLAPWVATRPEEAVKLAERSRHSLVRKFVARRLAEDLQARPGPVDAILRLAMRSRAPQEILRGLGQALHGWRKAPRPSAWTTVAARLGRSPDTEVRRLVTELGVVFGDGQAIQQLREVALDESAAGDVRRVALRAVIDSGQADGPMLLRLIRDRVTAAVAIGGLARHDVAEAPAAIIRMFDSLDGEAQGAAVAMLVSRAAYARTLLEAIGARKVPRHALSAYHARQVQSLGDAALDRQLAEVWGQLRTTSDDKKALMERFKATLRPETIALAEVARGRTMFAQLCAPCHKLYGEGGTLGPELTGADRHNLDYLLHNIVDPSGEVGADFRMSVVQMKDGRTLNGFVGNQSARTLTVRGVGDPVTVERGEVASVQPSDVSVMPEGLLEPFTPEQIRDLFGYLMSRGP